MTDTGIEQAQTGIAARFTALAVVAIVLFCMLFLPSLHRTSLYHSDEQFYTNSAIYMLQHNDLLTPHYADGQLRLNKPIVTYWVLMGSYTLFGINFFAARLPFLLAGCLLLWVTYHLALRLFEQRSVALFAVVILASNNQCITLALRATPDVLQALFLNVSLFGFVGLLFYRGTRRANLFWAYIGVSLAVETKGLLGLAPLVLVLGTWACLPRKNERLQRMFHLPAMALAIGAALAWYVAMALIHGLDAMGHFYQDQVGERLSGPPYYVVRNALEYIWGLIRHFLPWSLLVPLAILSPQARLRQFVSNHRGPFAFGLAWLGFLLVVFSFGNICRTRYLIPAYPLLAVLLAALLNHLLGFPRLGGTLKRGFSAMVGIVGVVGAAIAIVGFNLHNALVMAGGTIAAAAVVSLMVMRKKTLIPAPMVMAVNMMVSIAVFHALVAPVFNATEVASVADCLSKSFPRQSAVTVWSDSRDHFTRQMYLLTKGQILIQSFPRGPLPADLDQRSNVLLTARTAENPDLTPYSVSPCGFKRRAVDGAKLWTALRKGRGRQLFTTLQEPLILGRRQHL